MKRPSIPVRVKLAVLERQAIQKGLSLDWLMLICHGHKSEDRVKLLLDKLFNGDKVELDHDPALSLRRFNKRTGKYTPDANNPEYLVYRPVAEHLQKTVGRKPGAERTVTTKGSDVWLNKKFSRPKRPRVAKMKIPSRPFPKRKKVKW